VLVKSGKTRVSVVSDEYRECGLRALKLKALLAMANATGEQAYTDDAVANSHDCGKTGRVLARKCRSHR
jgi:hypothetical protein